jgi:hypothetical protein
MLAQLRRLKPALAAGWVKPQRLRAAELRALQPSLTSLRKNSLFWPQQSPVAKAETEFAGLTVRLEAAPFQNMTRTGVFPQAVKRRPDANRFSNCTATDGQIASPRPPIQGYDRYHRLIVSCLRLWCEHTCARHLSQSETWCTWGRRAASVASRSRNGRDPIDTKE